MANKTLFYFRTHFDDPTNQGVISKCKSIAQASGKSFDMVFFTRMGLHLNDTEIPVLPYPNTKHSLRHYLLYYVHADRWMRTQLQYSDYATLFVRHAPAHWDFVRLLRAVKAQSPAMYILVEFPTWPYDAVPHNGWLGRAGAILDRIYRKKMAHWVDKFIHYGTENTVLGRPAILLDNGIDIERIPQRTTHLVKANTFVMLAAGSWSEWHGLDRLIRGIYHYYGVGGTCKIQLNIVGNGPALHGWKTLVKSLEIENSVHFYEACSGEVYNRLFENADMAVGSLGLHRIGLECGSPLKHREYCVRGIPFVLAGVDRDFPPNWPYTRQFPADDTIINMEEILQFYQNIQLEHPNYVHEMHQYARQYLSWEKKLQAVFA